MRKFKKILLYDFTENKEFVNSLKRFTDEVIILTTKDDYQDDLSSSDFEGVDCFITNVFDNFHNHFFENSSVTHIFTMFTDISMFDRDFLDKSGIKLQNISGQATESVCEFALGILLHRYRSISETIKFSQDGGEGFFGFKGEEISRKQVGIIGKGKIGTHFGNIVKALGAKIDFISKTTQSKTLQQIIAESDIIFISCPFTEVLMTEDLMLSIKKDAVILNPSRIDLFDVEALYNFLQTRTDVTLWQDEAMNDIWKAYKEKFMKLENVLITPGCAFFTEENPIRGKKLLLKNIQESFVKK